MIQSIEDGRKEDGNRSIADKIIKRLHDLNKTVENNQGRWAWELLQNAKDSIENDRTVSVQIEIDEDNVEFRHNGAHFTEQDIRGLINQISSKEVQKGEQTKKIGRFGTGFLTTHLLSKAIKIKGILETANGEFYKFKFLLDRQGGTTSELVPKIESSWRDFNASLEKINNYDKNNLNTSFRYHLNTEEQKKIARIGAEEFSKLVPFVLVFVPEINSVKIIDKTQGNNTFFEKEKESTDDLIIPILKTENETKSNTLILSVSNDRLAIATKIEDIGGGYSIQDIHDFPKLFCNFPLIGTEKFNFPVIINSIMIGDEIKLSHCFFIPFANVIAQHRFCM